MRATHATFQPNQTKAGSEFHIPDGSWWQWIDTGRVCCVLRRRSHLLTLASFDPQQSITDYQALTISTFTCGVREGRIIPYEGTITVS